ncbi:hypothetical protein DSO57_1012490 [Entomophthora muscae]|uniref:Uncharacterized protein n=1 Tax=Entomophthora muscae TaxID=34485 RepID=A0ACC2SIR0_9FUNG|nr:hypothetical protein DSO57_1012490 [Entomophthora muscae]
MTDSANKKEGPTIFNLDIEIPDSKFLLFDPSRDNKVVSSKRIKCPECSTSVKYFCYYCRKNVGAHADKVPQIDLPIPLDIIKHPHENDGKSTGLHAKLLAPNSTTVLTYPIPLDQYLNPEKCLLLFPGPTAVPIGQILSAEPADAKETGFERIVVIEGTWYQAHQMVRDTPALSKMKHITFAHSYQTVFWRFQQTDPCHLATIEAIYFVYREYLEAKPSESYNIGSLLFYYNFFYQLIQDNYKSGQAKKDGRKFTSRHSTNYIKDSDSPSH